jgi:ABC-type antimicrobial peptide transport system permease subunit
MNLRLLHRIAALFGRDQLDGDLVREIISYSVTRQTQEIGIGMALGATHGIVQRSVLGRTLKLAPVGIAVGEIASFVVSKLIASLLFNTDSNDPLTFAGVTFLLVSVALLAGYFPALRATGIDPTSFGVKP